MAFFKRESQPSLTCPRRVDDRIILHFDYDCFYASVIEHANPALKTLPLAVQQKQIIVTCNYVARSRGLYKLQSLAAATAKCPEVVIVRGEDLSIFRDASKMLYKYFAKRSWNHLVEKQGFDEVWTDVTDMIDFNMDILNFNSLETSFFHISLKDPLRGFNFDATTYAGHIYPSQAGNNTQTFRKDLAMQLRLGSHLARFLRLDVEERFGYTSCCGIATSKTISKLVGARNKPRGQTTFVPPYEDHIIPFMDTYEVGDIPSIGRTLSGALRELYTQCPVPYRDGLVDGPPTVPITVKAIRKSLSLDILDSRLAGQGLPKNSAARLWALLHGCDDTPVSKARKFPLQISLEDTYLNVKTRPQVVKALEALTRSLLSRLDKDLKKKGQWRAHPKTLRLQIRPRQAIGPDGVRRRDFRRLTKSKPLPREILSLSLDRDVLVQVLVKRDLVPMFFEMIPEDKNLNIALINIAATKIEAHSDRIHGMNITKLFQNQDQKQRTGVSGNDESIPAPLLGLTPSNLKRAREDDFDLDSDDSVQFSENEQSGLICGDDEKESEEQDAVSLTGGRASTSNTIPDASGPNTLSVESLIAQAMEAAAERTMAHSSGKKSTHTASINTAATFDGKADESVVSPVFTTITATASSKSHLHSAQRFEPVAHSAACSIDESALLAKSDNIDHALDDIIDHSNVDLFDSTISASVALDEISESDTEIVNPQSAGSSDKFHRWHDNRDSVDFEDSEKGISDVWHDGNIEPNATEGYNDEGDSESDISRVAEGFDYFADWESQGGGILATHVVSEQATGIWDGLENDVKARTQGHSDWEDSDVETSAEHNVKVSEKDESGSPRQTQRKPWIELHLYNERESHSPMPVPKRKRGIESDPEESESDVNSPQKSGSHKPVSLAPKRKRGIDSGPEESERERELDSPSFLRRRPAESSSPPETGPLATARQRSSESEIWEVESDEPEPVDGTACSQCAGLFPVFAMAAHKMHHRLEGA